MKILFLSYWGINEGLTQATVLPHVQLLSRHRDVSKVILITIERSLGHANNLDVAGIKHIPLQSKRIINTILTKVLDFIVLPKKISTICFEENIDLIVCRSSLAGAIGHLIWKKTRISYVVESFEPHADYMYDSDIWKRWDLRYIVQLYFERKQKDSALILLPVSNQYAKVLEKESLNPNRIITVPCCVELNKFCYSSINRSKIRTTLRIQSESIVGIYVGKFGGIYYEKEAFDFIKEFFSFFNNFHLILLTDYDSSTLERELVVRDIESEKVHVLTVLRHDVHLYLSASDFAFTFYKQSPSKKYLSPIKIGEYWSNGLPVLIEEGIGDDAQIIKEEGGGLLVDVKRKIIDIAELTEVIKIRRSFKSDEIKQLAKKYRDISRVEIAYNQIIDMTINHQ